MSRQSHGEPEASDVAADDRRVVTPSFHGGGIVLADDHKVVREGTRQILEAAGIAVVAEAATAAETLQLVHDLLPATLVVDLRLPDMSGVEVVRRICEAGLPVRCLVLSAFDDNVYVAEALAAGAYGYLLKTATASELVAAVSAVAEGTMVLDRALGEAMVRRLRDENASALADLTPREIDVVRLMARGKSNKEIALDLQLGVRTIETYVSNILTKLGVRSRTEAVLRAIDSRLVSVEPLSRGRLARG